jgi:hypothetical protein
MIGSFSLYCWVFWLISKLQMPLMNRIFFKKCTNDFFEKISKLEKYAVFEFLFIKANVKNKTSVMQSFY